MIEKASSRSPAVMMPASDTMPVSVPVLPSTLPRAMLPV
jgi:hypothetical protein